MLVAQPVSRERDQWYLSFSFDGGSFTRSFGRGTWLDARTLGERVEVLLERWEELEEDAWRSLNEVRPDGKKGRDMVGRRLVEKS